MSTAGKVLSILVTLALIGWVILLSMVAQLNSNYGQVVQKNQTQFEALEKQVQDAVAQLREAQAGLERDSKAISLLIFAYRQQVADTERLLSEAREALARVNLQVEAQQVAKTNAEDTRDKRQQELDDLKAQRGEEIRRNEQLIAATAEDRKQWEKLHDEFQKVLSENTELVKKVRESRKSDGRRVRPATLVH